MREGEVGLGVEGFGERGRSLWRDYVALADKRQTSHCPAFYISDMDIGST